MSKKLSSLFAATAVLCGCFFMAGCKSEDNSTTPVVEFAAADADIANYGSWTKTAENLVGPDPAGIIGPAHESGNADVRRTVFINKGSATKVSGKWENGTILIKEMRKTDGTLLGAMGMAKRGASFNPDHNGWEWFMVGSDGKIADRGANLMNGMCNGCHSTQKSTYDYVFTKQ